MARNHSDVHTMLWIGNVDCFPFCGIIDEGIGVYHNREQWPLWLDGVWPDTLRRFAPSPHSNLFIWQ